ncbi:MAG: hypothetical protein RIS35_2458 [Pseudomonadota bacterium]|jgi:hypothetical protein
MTTRKLPALVAETFVNYVVEYPVARTEISDDDSRVRSFQKLPEANAFFQSMLDDANGPLPGGHGKHNITLTEVTRTMLRQGNAVFEKPKAKPAPPKRASVVKVKAKAKA